MNYEDRKKQLNEAMKATLRTMPYGYLFNQETEPDKYFTAKKWSEPGQEYLSEVFLTDEDEESEVAVVTIRRDEDYPDECAFTEFSNDEMEEIMRLCGVEVPEPEEEKVVYVSKNLALGILETQMPLVYGVLNTASYDVMGYCFVAGDSPECLESVGCFEEDIQKADALGVGETLKAEWPAENAVIIIKMKDERKK